MIYLSMILGFYQVEAWNKYTFEEFSKSTEVLSLLEEEFCNSIF